MLEAPIAMPYTVQVHMDISTSPTPPDLQKSGIGRNTLFGMAIDAIVFALGIILSVVLTRSFGPEQRGVYVVLVTTNVLLSGLAHLGLGSALSTMLARGRYRLGQVHLIALPVAFAMGAVCLLATALLFPFLASSVFRNVPFEYLLVALTLVITTIYQAYWVGMMIGTGRVFLMNKFNLGVNVVNAFLMILMVGVLKLGIQGFLFAWVTSALGGFVTTLWLTARMDKQEWPPARDTAGQLLGFGLRSHGAQVAHQLFLRLDVYIVNVLIGSAGVGVYSLSTSLAEKLWIPLNAIYASSIGKISQLPKDESAQLTAKVTRTAVLLMLSVAVPFGLISPWLIPFLYGFEFEAAVLPLVILLGGTLGFAVMMVVNTYILGQMQRPGLLSLLAWLQLAISVPLYVGLIAWEGIVGAAIASTLTYLIAMATALYVFRRDSGLPLSQVLVPRRSDFSDYARVITPLLTRIPGLSKLAKRPS
jgi:O-antigen/teichoic acid export membrane protein